jgi:hypothetical protein
VPVAFPSQEPGGGKRPKSMMDGLPKITAVIAELKHAPDADIQFLTGLETQVLQYAQMRTQAQQGPPPGASVPGMAGGLPGAGAPGAAGMGGQMQGTPLPPPDELRRALQGAA